MASKWWFEEVGSRLAERTALLAAIGTTGATFGRSLMPRSVTGQALSTGLTGSVNYGLLVTSQASLWSVASLIATRMMPTDPPAGVNPARAYRGRVRLIAYGTYVAVGLGAAPLARAIPQRESESMARAIARSYLERSARVARIGPLAVGVLDVADMAIPVGSPRLRMEISNALIALTGAGLAGVEVHRQQAVRRKLAGEPGSGVSRSAVVAGCATAIGITAVGRVEELAAGGVSKLLAPRVPEPLGRTVGHALCLGVLGFAIRTGVEKLYRRTENSARAVESLHATPPAVDTASGGPASLVDWEAMSKEGRRFAGLSLAVEEIQTVTGRPGRQPVRVFIPMVMAPTPQEGAQTAIAEMERLGAFDRSLICLCPPTGTGYVNNVLTETLEYLTAGDCATVAVQYSMRPSFLSLDRVAVGRANTIALLEAVAERVASMPEQQRPRLVMFAESLGAHIGQDVALHRGTQGFRRFGVTRGLFVGTPEKSEWAAQWRAHKAQVDPEGQIVEVASFEDFEALSVEAREASRFILVSHNEDPITKFGPEIAVQQPAWLSNDPSARPPGVPPEMRWRPLTTFFMTLADVLNAMSSVPGQFQSHGHDYRADIPRFAVAAFDLPVDEKVMADIEAALRLRELKVAEFRLIADQITSVRKSVSSQLGAWGVVDAGVVDGLMMSSPGAPHASRVE